MKLLISVLLSFIVLSAASVWFTKTVNTPPTEDLAEISSSSAPALIEPSSSSVPPLPLIEDSSVEPEIIEEPLTPAVSFSSLKTMPGELLSISLSNFENPSNIDVINPFGTEVSFFEQNDLLISLLPISYNIVPGDYTLTLSDGAFTEDFLITVENKDFAAQNIGVDESITSDTVDNSTANNEYNLKIQPLKYQSINDVLWEGTFIEPVVGYRLTSDFGEIRTINEKPSSRHGGIDLAAPTGTPTVATNGGEILFADFIQLTGNTVIIEHGLGLKSYYYHMDSIAVSAGDIVEKGDPIGTIGTTGFSTGPHLHYAMSIGTIYINPWSMFTDEVSFS